jgi:integrase
MRVPKRSSVASPGKFIGGASKRKEKVDPFSLKDLHQLEAKVLEKKYPAYYEFVLMMARTGVRIGEALGLQWKDIDMEKEMALIRRNIPIHHQVQRTKTKSSERSVDLSPELVEALRSLFHRRREEYFAKGESEIPKWVFCGKRGEPFQYSNFRRRCWLRALREAKVWERTPHDLPTRVSCFWPGSLWRTFPPSSVTKVRRLHYAFICTGYLERSGKRGMHSTTDPQKTSTGTERRDWEKL